ncbi:hypothetical protein BD779DRAFT_1537360 [Infundibulicybe gibba]|nr:hypothetical protein BD779DRAFT_1537360 [Infundibulicybe gibba]
MWLSGDIIIPIPQFERKDVLKPLFLVDRLERDSARISFSGFDSAPPFYQPLEPQNLEVNILAKDISYVTSAVLPSDGPGAGVVAGSAASSVCSRAKPSGSTRVVAFPSCMFMMSTSTNMTSVTKTARVATKKPAFIIRGRGLLARPQVSLGAQDMGSIAGSPPRGSRSTMRRAYVADEVNKSLTTQLSTVLGLNSRRSSNISPFDQEGSGCIWRLERTPVLGVKSELQRISEKANVARRRFSKLRRSRESWCMSMGVKTIQ